MVSLRGIVGHLLCGSIAQSRKIGRTICLGRFMLIDASERAFSGRLSIVENDGKVTIDYCTGQYWPTEYRAVVCAVLASALWEYHLPDIQNTDNKGDAIRAKFRRMFGRGIQSRWFN